MKTKEYTEPEFGSWKWLAVMAGYNKIKDLIKDEDIKLALENMLYARIKKFEYKVEINLTPQKLMMFGKLGWELVKVVERNYKLYGIPMQDLKYIFKRPIL